jgi:diguanylate cyclase (GGDEF)-like protein
VKRVLRLESIKSRILALALAATLIPALTTALLSYRQNHRALVEKFAERLNTSGTNTSRELDLWIKEKVYDVRVFASSYEVSENVGLAAGGGSAGHGRLTAYLSSVRRRFGDYASLLVVNPEGRVVASSAGAGDIALPAEVLRELRTADAVLGEPTLDSTGSVALTITVPIATASGGVVGAMSANLRFATAENVLRRFVPPDSGEVYLLARDGTLIASSRAQTKPLSLKMPAAALAALRDRAAPTVEYADYRGVQMVGNMEPMVRSTWSVVAQMPRTQAFAEIAQLRNTTLLTLLVLVLVVGAIAYTLGRLIVRPLEQLTQGAGEVAAGNLDVDLPVRGGGEVAYLTQMFNEMVTRIRAAHDKLERLSETDGLTGLANRRHLMEALDVEEKRGTRYGHAFSLLMIDVDHFKKYNDTYGHQAGDVALARVGTVLKESIRDVDRAGRYGGEEFAVVLPETPLAAALVVAERIRARMEGEKLPVKSGEASVTLSIGVAERPTHAATAAEIVAVADAALYDAKEEGRNKVMKGKRRPRKSRSG